MAATRLQQASALLTGFAARTGVTGGAPQVRYLWTDAFATCTLLGLGEATGAGEYREAALRLVDAVHHVLGRHRGDGTRSGWLSGLDATAGEAHPTRGGLRIGKRLPERRAGEPLDERLEWDRDGQYFHYLTKWMHALDQVTRVTGDPTFTRWARELAATAHRAFVYEPRPGAGKRMYWKMSVDLTRPLVPSMGQHDPLDGLVTCLQLEATAAACAAPAPEEDLAGMRAELHGMIDRHALATDDLLGLGGLLVDAYRVEQLNRQHPALADAELVDALLAAAHTGLTHPTTGTALRLPAARRLAFRELGLAIGLAAVESMAAAAARDPASFAGGAGARRIVGALARAVPLRAQIESFWLRPEHRAAATWLDHLDINEVMLATSLVPDGFLVLRRPC
jgi:hypothetical protein